MNPATKVSIWTIVVLLVVVGALFLIVAGQLHPVLGGNPPKPTSEFGFSQAFRILTNSDSPYGTRASFWAVLLAVSGFLVVPAMIGGVAGVVLGEIVAKANEARSDETQEVTADNDARMLEDAAAAAKRLAARRRAEVAPDNAAGPGGSAAAPSL